MKCTLSITHWCCKSAIWWNLPVSDWTSQPVSCWPQVRNPAKPWPVTYIQTQSSTHTERTLVTVAVWPSLSPHRAHLHFQPTFAPETENIETVWCKATAASSPMSYFIQLCAGVTPDTACTFCDHVYIPCMHTCMRVCMWGCRQPVEPDEIALILGGW